MGVIGGTGVQGSIGFIGGIGVKHGSGVGVDGGINMMIFSPLLSDNLNSGRSGSDRFIRGNKILSAYDMFFSNMGIAVGAIVMSTGPEEGK
ncbi:MAG: hypothetical protein ACM3NG_00360 [Candidatus Doudnabacteria bacterium]